MFGTALIVFREVLEAALIIGIVAAATRGIPGRSRYLWAGVGIGIAGSIVVAAMAEAICTPAAKLRATRRKRTTTTGRLFHST